MGEWWIWLGLGLVSVFFGILALGNTMAASIAVTTLTGALLLVAGGIQTVLALCRGGDAARPGQKALSATLGGLIAALGLSFLLDPLKGTVSLAFLVTVLIGLGGAIRLAMAWGMRRSRFYWLMLGSGALSILLAGLILANFAVASVSLLGIILGLELVLNGLALIVLSLFIRTHDAGEGP